MTSEIASKVRLLQPLHITVGTIVNLMFPLSCFFVVCLSCMHSSTSNLTIIQQSTLMTTTTITSTGNCPSQAHSTCNVSFPCPSTYSIRLFFFHPFFGGRLRRSAVSSNSSGNTMPINYSDEPNTVSIGDTNVQQATTNQLDQLAIGTGDTVADASPQQSLALGNSNYTLQSASTTAATASSSPTTTA